MTVRLEVVAPATGKRCPAWLEGRLVFSACGDIAPAVPVLVVYDRLDERRRAADLAARLLAECDYRHVVVCPAACEGEG